MKEWEQKSETGGNDQTGHRSLDLHLDIELHQRVKMRASLEGVTMNELISRAIKVYLSQSAHAP